MQTFTFNPCSVEKSVESPSEHIGFGVISILVANQRTILAKVKLLAKLPYHFYCGIVKRYVTLTRCAFKLADLDLG